MLNSIKNTNSVKSRSAGKKLFIWLDQNILTILTSVLIVAIPLYPKIPLAELIEGYIVRLRFEDLLVLFTFGVWFVQLVRGKLKLPKNKVAKMIYLYLGIAFLSILSALVITQTVPLIKAHVFKLVFHFLRRLEYFSLFFVAYAAVKDKRDLALFLKLAGFTLFGVVIYGIGQKYFYWPAFSTMNREFSKGIMLYLQPNTRLFSTFGGHYDLAAYLMMALAFTFPAAWLVKNFKYKILFYSLSLLAFWSLVLTTSRTSFIGYFAGISFAAFFLVRYRSLFWAAKRWLVVAIISAVMMFFFSNLLERFTQVIPNRDTRETILAIQKTVNQPFVKEPEGSRSISELPSLLAFLFKGEKPVEIPPADIPEDQLSIVASSSDIPPTPYRPTPTPTPTPLPADVSLESEDVRRQTAESEGRTYAGPLYSENALKYGLSMGIRLDVLWPNAINAFKKNPLLGTGYSTLVKSNLGEFTYAESTDNDYLRALGETGLLGFISFAAIIYFIFRYARMGFTNKHLVADLISLGTMSAIVALLVNALYIDVFESSKIAYNFWILAAMSVRAAELYRPKESQKL